MARQCKTEKQDHGHPSKRYRLKRHYEPKTTAPPPTISTEHLRAMERLATFFERSRLNDYVTLIDKKERWFRINLLGGIARGIGMAIGFVLLGALATMLIVKIAGLNLPVISEFFAKLLDMVEKYRTLQP